MRLIDAHDLWTEIMMLPHNGDMISSVEVEKAIAEAPTADAVTVVRCEKCRYGHWLSGAKKYACRHPLYTGGNKHRGDHFCSCGERRNDNA